MASIPLSALARGLQQRTTGWAGDVAERLEAKISKDTRNATEGSLAVVLLGWDEDRTEAAVRRLSAVLGDLSGWKAQLCVVDNRRAPGPVKQLAFGSLISGDNSAYEFSGYDRGHDFHRQSGVRPDAWLFANDRFDAYHDPLQALSPGTERALFVVQARS